MAGKGICYGVGIGPGDPSLLTLKAVSVFKSVDLIFTVTGKNSKRSISQNVVDAIEGLETKCQPLIFSMSTDLDLRQAVVRENAVIILKALQAGKNCAFATLGDVLTYSTFGYIMKVIQEEDPEIVFEMIPGVTSYNTFAARAGKILVEDLEHLKIIPGFDAKQMDQIQVQPNEPTVIMKTYKSRNALIEKFSDEKRYSLLYGAYLGMENEFISSDKEEILARPNDYLSMMLIKRRAEG